MNFDELPLLPALKAALAEAGYNKPTPIQQQAIGPALAGTDLLGCAQTGTGKTAAFALPVLQKLDGIVSDTPCLRALVLVPTRELAVQIGESFTRYGRHMDLWHTVIYGGVSEKTQIAELRRGVDLLIATPGRLLDLMGRGHLSLKHVELMVLDEADRMLDMGFIHDVRRIVRELPKERQTLLFSATMPRAIQGLAQSLLKNPVEVSVTPVATPADRLEHTVFFTAKEHKSRLLLDMLKHPECRSVLVFSRTKHGANRLAKLLAQHGFAVAAIHGNKSQGARTRALDGFRSHELSVLVATDVAARGVDVEGVTHVINYDLPNEPDTYVHRVGRTARAGAAGVAWSLCDGEERTHLVAIEKLLGAKIPRAPGHDQQVAGSGSVPAPRSPARNRRQGAAAASGKRRRAA